MKKSGYCREVFIIKGLTLGKIFKNNSLLRLGFLDGTMESLTEQMLKRDLRTMKKWAHTLCVKVTESPAHTLFLILVVMESATLE